MDLKRLSHLVALARLRNFVRAAEQVHLSQSALTRSIQAIEAECGMRLFDRGSEVTLTPAGEFVLERARRLVADAGSLKRDIDLYRRRQLGDIAFGVGAFPAGTFLTPLLADLRREFPGINLRIEVSNCSVLLRRLIDEDIEFIVADIEELPLDRRLTVRPLRSEEAAFYVRSGHPLAGTTAKLSEVWRYGLASGRVPLSAATEFARLLGSSLADPARIAFECEDIEMLKKLTLCSDLVLAMPDRAVEQEVLNGLLRRLSVEGLPPLFSATGTATVRGRSLAPMAEVILDRLRAAAPGHQPLER